MHFLFWRRQVNFKVTATYSRNKLYPFMKDDVSYCSCQSVPLGQGLRYTLHCTGATTDRKSLGSSPRHWMCRLHVWQAHVTPPAPGVADSFTPPQPLFALFYSPTKPDHCTTTSTTQRYPSTPAAWNTRDMSTKSSTDFHRKRTASKKQTTDCSRRQ